MKSTNDCRRCGSATLLICNFTRQLRRLYRNECLFDSIQVRLGFILLSLVSKGWQLLSGTAGLCLVIYMGTEFSHTHTFSQNSLWTAGIWTAPCITSNCLLTQFLSLSLTLSSVSHFSTTSTAVWFLRLQIKTYYWSQLLEVVLLFYVFSFVTSQIKNCICVQSDSVVKEL